MKKQLLIAAVLFDYNLAYIYSEEELLLPGEGNNTLVLGISKSFGLFN